MRKRTYRAKEIKQIDVASVGGKVEGRRLVFGIDVAKEDCFGRLVTEDELVVATVKWNQLTDTRQLIGWLQTVRGCAAELEVALEPSGTYADALVHQLKCVGLSVFRVSGKRCHDAKEVFDGVPSMHDAKAADVLAHLHLRKLSARWVEDPKRRELSAYAQMLTIHQQDYQRALHRLDALLARHWPELTQVLELTSATLVALLAKCGGPSEVWADGASARWTMHKAGGAMLSNDKIESVISSARSTIGVPMIEQEQQLMRELAAEAIRHRQQVAQAESQLVKRSKGNQPTERMAAVVGDVTAAVISCRLGDPSNYPAAASYVKAAGLNLKENSSGKRKGQLSITKRGSSEVRRLLYLAALRLIQQRGDPIVRAWYVRKVESEGGRRKNKAVVAVMRKLLAALWHVAAGKQFDSERLFDVRRLGIETPKHAA
jgi:transposase